MRRTSVAVFLMCLSFAHTGLAQDSVATFEDAPSAVPASEPTPVHLEESPAESEPLAGDSETAPSPSVEKAPPSQAAAAPVASAPVAAAPWTARKDEQAILDEEIELIEDQRDEKYSLGGPIAVMATGGGVTLFGLSFLVQGLVLRSVESVGEGVDSQGSSLGKTLVTVGLAGIAGGGAFLIGGGVWLGKRIGRRRPYNERIEELEERRDFYSSVRVEPLLGKGRLGLGISGAF